RGSPARVLNSGVQGYDTHQQATYLSERGWALEPDVIVLGFYENDITLRNPGSEYRRQVADDGTFRGGGGLRGIVPTWLVYRVKHLRSVVFVSRSLRELRWRFFPPEDNYHVRAIFLDEPTPTSELAWQQVTESLDSIRSEAADRGVEVIVAIFPYQAQMDESALVHTYQGRLREITGELGLEVIDLLETFRESNRNGSFPYIPFDSHPDPIGHRLAGEALAPTVAATLARRAAGASD
ncbi:MAG: hypothetical protein ACR2PQ_12340, partial [Myxococcota bacterium]